MTLQIGLTKIMRNAALLSVPFFAFSQDSQLSLKYGVYVNETSPCKGAPNAAIMSWDGVGFSGAHSSKCTSRVLRQGADRFKVTTTCAAAGDGSPNLSRLDSVDTLLLKRLSDIRFEITRENQSRGSYRWCSVKAVD